VNQIVETERLIANARAHVSAGMKCVALKQPIDLRGLEGVIANITQNLSRLPRDEALSQRNALLVLFDELGQLDEEITKLHRETGEQLRRMSSQRFATSAYNTPKKG
jgi:transcriptional regulator NrdR family protein